MAVLLTNKGKEIVASRIADLLATPQYLAVGTGAGTSGATDTTLFSEVGARVPVNFALTTTTTTNDTLVCTATWTNFGESVTLTNTGLFTSLSGGSLLCKGDGIGMTLETGDGITVIWNLAVG
jgi:hypothetical protein